jgi:hypothetical protein
MATSYTVVVPEFSQASFYDAELKVEYRGFTYRKEPGYPLYFIEPVPGKLLPASLGGRFTGPGLIHRAVDRWYLDNPNHALANAPTPPEPRRLHRKTINAEGIEFEDNIS